MEKSRFYEQWRPSIAESNYHVRNEGRVTFIGEFTPDEFSDYLKMLTEQGKFGSLSWEVNEDRIEKGRFKGVGIYSRRGCVSFLKGELHFKHPMVKFGLANYFIDKKRYKYYLYLGDNEPVLLGDWGLEDLFHYVLARWRCGRTGGGLACVFIEDRHLVGDNFANDGLYDAVTGKPVFVRGDRFYTYVENGVLCRVIPDYMVGDTTTKKVELLW